MKAKASFWHVDPGSRDTIRYPPDPTGHFTVQAGVLVGVSLKRAEKVIGLGGRPAVWGPETEKV